MAIQITTDVTLNGQRASITLFEDISGDGVADNQEKAAIPDGITEIGLESLDGDPENTYWMRLDLETFDEDLTPEVHSVEVTDFDPVPGADLITDTTLNGETALIQVREDPDGTGVARAANLVAPDGQAETRVYGIQFDETHSYSISVDLETSDEEVSPEVHSVEADSTVEFIDAVAASLDSTAEPAVIDPGTVEVQAASGSLSSDAPNAQAVGGPSDIQAAPAGVDLLGQEPGVDPGVAAVGADPAGASLLGNDTDQFVAGPASIEADAAVADLFGQASVIDPGESSVQAISVVLELTGQGAGVEPGVAQISADVGSLEAHAVVSDRVFDSVLLAGQVTLNGDPVEDAAVYAIDDLEDFEAAGGTDLEDFRGKATTTDSNGDYSLRVDAGERYHLAYQYEDTEGNLYNSESKPFLTPNG